MRKALTKAGVALAACALTVGMCACGSESTSSATGTGTGDNSSVLITSQQKAGEQTFETVTFGAYQGQTIEWYVLDEQDGKKLLISKEILDSLPYDDAYVGYEWGSTNIRPASGATWETSSLRAWLNDTFLSAAFSSTEAAAIAATDTSDALRAGTPTAAGALDEASHTTGSVSDKVFLLSLAEVKAYFDNDAARMATATDYAKAQGVFVNDSGYMDGYSPWWTRSVGYYAGYAAVVVESGYVHGDGFRMDGDFHDGFEHGTDFTSDRGGSFGVRPCIWVDASALA